MCHMDYIKILVEIESSTFPNQGTIYTLIIVQACQKEKGRNWYENILKDHFNLAVKSETIYIQNVSDFTNE